MPAVTLRLQFPHTPSHFVRGYQFYSLVLTRARVVGLFYVLFGSHGCCLVHGYRTCGSYAPRFRPIYYGYLRSTPCPAVILRLYTLPGSQLTLPFYFSAYARCWLPVTTYVVPFGCHCSSCAVYTCHCPAQFGLLPVAVTVPHAGYFTFGCYSSSTLYRLVALLVLRGCAVVRIYGLRFALLVPHSSALVAAHARCYAHHYLVLWTHCLYA